MTVDGDVKNQNRQTIISFPFQYTITNYDAGEATKIFLLEFCCLQLALFVLYSSSFSNRLNPDHGQQDVGPDLDPNCLTLCIVFLNMF